MNRWALLGLEVELAAGSYDVVPTTTTIETIPDEVVPFVGTIGL